MKTNKIILALTLSLCLTLAVPTSFRAASTIQMTNCAKSKQSSSLDIDQILSERITVPASTNVSAQVAALRNAPTQVDRINILENDSDFVFDFFDPAARETTGEGGRTIGANRGTFPAVTGNGVAMTVGIIGPCGINTPHVHPQATEINYITNGTFISGFIAENGARLVQNTLYAGQAIVFPKGAIHFEANIECEPAIFVAAFNDEDPGVSQIAQNFFVIDAEVLTPVLGGVSEREINSIKNGIPANVADGIAACKRRCGLEDEPPY